jgi:putative Mn2+ efflux pump MntP
MALAWTTVAFPPAVIGVAYEAGMGFTGATMSALAVSTGALPTGVTVSSTTDPRLIGTPTATGTFTFTLTGAGVVSGSYSIQVYGSAEDLQLQAINLTPEAASYQQWPSGSE